MAGHKAQQEITVDSGSTPEKLGEADAAVIAVDVLTEKSYILISGIGKALYLVKHILRSAAALSAPHIRHNAVGAIIVAAIHYRHPRLI